MRARLGKTVLSPRFSLVQSILNRGGAGRVGRDILPDPVQQSQQILAFDRKSLSLYADSDRRRNPEWGAQGNRQYAFAPRSPVVAFRVSVFPLRPKLFHEPLDADDPRAFFSIGAPQDPVNVAIGFRRQQGSHKRVVTYRQHHSRSEAEPFGCTIGP